MKYDSGSITDILIDIKKDIEKSSKDQSRDITKQISHEKKKMASFLSLEFDKRVSDGRKNIKEEMMLKLEHSELVCEKRILEKKKQIFDSFINDFMSNADSLRKDKSYKSWLKEIVAKNSKKKQKEVVIFCNPIDSKNIKGVKIVPDSRITLGIIIEDVNKTYRKDFTLNSFLNSNKEEISRWFFDEIK